MTRHAKLRTKEELGLPKWVPAVEKSFDDPPIVLRQDRLKLSFSALGFAVMGGLALLIPVRVYSGWHLLMLGLLGLAAVTFGALAIVPTTLILDPKGLIQRSVFRSFEYSWSDFARFRWYARRGLLHVVVADLPDERIARLGWRRFLTRTVELGS
jgi:Bacterial PH domain